MVEPLGIRRVETLLGIGLLHMWIADQEMVRVFQSRRQNRSWGWIGVDTVRLATADQGLDAIRSEHLLDAVLAADADEITPLLRALGLS